jgi:DNA-binding NarL/FixJ family response regulator
MAGPGAPTTAPMRSGGRYAERVQHRLDVGVDDLAVAVGRVVARARNRPPPALTTPEPQRVAVLLAYAGGHTAREIADRRGIPEGTAKSWLRLGLRRISRLPAEDGLLDES